ncbi:hypothetical protein C5E45_19205 [Nocardia nova]|uniref:Uncharacterized protein n=1 Tax=Nocardia nova TaxID=37330 RepID=A0A2S6AMX5_9NOCA|nr:hypothetical protein [Nocardia nova]PPJ36553.1 hypothetical protein C5E45_19205 [Nocardia nova]
MEAPSAASGKGATFCGEGRDRRRRRARELDEKLRRFDVLPSGEAVDRAPKGSAATAFALTLGEAGAIALAEVEIFVVQTDFGDRELPLLVLTRPWETTGTNAVRKHSSEPE